MAAEAIKAQRGNTPETMLLLKILDGLHENGKARNSKLSTFFSIVLKSRTWNLTEHAKDCEKALVNRDVTQLPATTLAAALTRCNAESIAQCRFKGNAAEQNTLVKLLESTTPLNVEAVAKAIDQCDGKQLASQLKALGQHFQPTLKAALMLFGHASAAADRIVEALGSAGNSTPLAEDLSAALGILTNQQLYAKFKDGALCTRVRRYLIDEKQSFSMPWENSLLISTASPTDPRQQRYVDDVVKGKIPVNDVPEFLLDRELRGTLKKKPAGTAEALREQLHLGFRYRDQGRTPPRALTWPVADFYGKTDPERCNNLRYSFSEMLGIDVGAGMPSEMLEAAAMYRQWDNNHPLPELKSIIRKGGLKASVALHCITDLAGIPLLDKSAIARFDAAEDSDQIKNICLELMLPKDPDKKGPIEATQTGSEETKSSIIPSPPPLRRHSMVIPSHTEAWLERDPGNEENLEGDEIRFKPVVVKDGLGQRRRNSEDHSGMLKEIARKRAYFMDPVAGGVSQERRSEEEAMPVPMERGGIQVITTNLPRIDAARLLSNMVFGRHSINP